MYPQEVNQETSPTDGSKMSVELRRSTVSKVKVPTLVLPSTYINVLNEDRVIFSEVVMTSVENIPVENFRHSPSLLRIPK